MKKLGKTLKVRLKADDISKGTPVSPWACPIARAVARTVGVNVYDKAEDGTYLVGACYQYVRVGRKFYEMSYAGFVFIQNFDKGLPVKPVTLSLQAIN